MKLFAKLLPSALLLTLGSASLAAEGVITLAEGKPVEAPDNQIQRYIDSIHLYKGQDKLALTLTYYNGLDGKTGFKWLRINSSTMSYLTEKQFNGKNQLSVDVCGELYPGNNQFIVEAGGVKGSTFAWRLTTPSPKIISVVPASVEAGSTFIIDGENLSSDASAEVATINGASISCINATSKSATFKVPEDFQAGAGTIDLKVAGLEAGKAKVLVVKSVPKLDHLSSTYVAPSYNMTIYGGPFSTDVSKLKVTIGPFEANVVKSTTDSIVVTAPIGFAGSPWGINQPVKVWSNGVRSSNNLTVNCYSNGASGVIVPQQ